VKVLVVGGGGREHALCWKIAQSPLVTSLFCAPGNPGIARLATCVNISASSIDSLCAYAASNAIDLTVVGPEDPLACGIVDRFESEGLRIFGPSRAAVQLEASKAFAKRLMAEHGIPTAAYRSFGDASDAARYIKEVGAPIVVKADGLAAGKGVTVAATVEEAIDAIHAVMRERVFGNAGNTVVIEDRLEGQEATILAFSDGRTIVPMTPSQDHKPVFDGDQGPNTGGMGAYAPAPVVTRDMQAEIERTILRPCIEGLLNKGVVYRGVLYAGLMLTSSGPKVVEFNCRFGDPETQAVLPLLHSDLVPVLTACCDGRLNQVECEWNPGASVSVVVASGGYPGTFQKGKSITGVEDAERLDGVTVFHAGTRKEGDRLVTNGGRVLNVTAVGRDLPHAAQRAYRAVDRIHFEGAHFRRDIGAKALRGA
jgi:phosphoribosylamine--glycine ligase